jgi:hypothetical protein
MDSKIAGEGRKPPTLVVVLEFLLNMLKIPRQFAALDRQMDLEYRVVSWTSW